VQRLINSSLKNTQESIDFNNSSEVSIPRNKNIDGITPVSIQTKFSPQRKEENKEV